MGLFDKVFNPPSEKKYKGFLSAEERQAIDDLVDNDPDITYEEISEQVGRDRAAISRYLTRKRANTKQTVQDIIQQSQARAAAKILANPDSDIEAAFKSSLIQQIKGTPQKTMLEQMKEYAETVKQIKGTMHETGDTIEREMYQPESPLDRLDEMKQTLEALRDFNEIINPSPPGDTVSELIKAIKEMAPVFIQTYLAAQAGKGAGAQVAATILQQQQRPQIVTEAKVSLPEPVEHEHEEPEEDEGNVWLQVLHHILPLIDKTPVDAAKRLYAAQQYAETYGNEELASALVQLATMTEADVQATFLPIVMQMLAEYPDSSTVFNKLNSDEGKKWLRSTQEEFAKLLPEDKDED